MTANRSRPAGNRAATQSLEATNQIVPTRSDQIAASAPEGLLSREEPPVVAESDRPKYEPTTEERLSLAAAIAKPRRRVGLIDPSNVKRGECDLGQAVVDDLPFFVEVSPLVLALDFDGADAIERAGSVFRRLLDLGLTPVVCASSDRQRRHVFCRVSDRAATLRYLDISETNQIVRSFIRPPGAMHRSRKSRSVLLIPKSSEEAIERLSGLQRRRELGPTGRRLLNERSIPAGKSASELTYSFAKSAVNARWTAEDFTFVVLESGAPFRNVVGPRIERTDEEQVRDWICNRVWPDAVASVSGSPARATYGLSTLDRQDLAWAASHLSTGRTAASDLRVFTALLTKRIMCGRRVFDMSVREVAQAAGLSNLGTTTRALSRLQHASLVRRHRVSHQFAMTNSDAWELTLDSTGTESFPLELAERVIHAIQHDAFRNCIALGGSTLLIYVQILLNGSIHVEDLVRTLGTSKPRLQRHLKTMSELGLVFRQDNIYTDAYLDLDIVAKELGAHGRAERQASQFALQRRGRDEHQRGWEEARHSGRARKWNT